MTDYGKRSEIEITCPISHDTKNIGKGGVELMLPHDGQRSNPLRYHSGPQLRIMK